MQKSFTVRALLVLSLLGAWLAGPLGGAQVALAAPPPACFRIYLPVILKISGGNEQAPAGEAQPLPQGGPDCGTFPDFNGDGFADLAIGVPEKEVNNGMVDQTDAGLVHVIYGTGSQNGLYEGATATSPDDQIFHRALAAVPAAPNDNYGAALAEGDFNDDGYTDLAIGIPGANVDAHPGAGAVHVIYGSTTGLDVSSIEEWARGEGGLAGPTEDDAGFGTTLASGDFNDDGFADLAVGTPYATVDSDTEAGGVQIIYGGASGLTDEGDEWVTQLTNGFIASSPEPYDRFGLALATGDFDGDGNDDLAVGTPGENNGDDYIDAGSVQVFFGQGNGAPGDWGLIRFGAVAGAQHWRADSPNVDGAMEEEEAFGTSLAAADFDNDGFDDLAIGIPNETHGTGPGTLINGGSVNVIMGSASGLAATDTKPARLWHQDATDVDNDVEAGELFGHSLAAADFDHDGFADLAIGVPGEKFLGIKIGAVHVMYGTGIGLTGAGDELRYDPVNPAANDSYGWTLTTGDYDGDDFVDLAVGAYRDHPTGVGPNGTGSIFIHYSNANGVSQSDTHNFYAGHNGLKGTNATDDHFSSALSGSPFKP